MKLYFWRKPESPLRPVHPNNYVLEAVDAAEPIETMRLYTQQDVDDLAAAIALQSHPRARDAYRVGYKVGYEAGTQAEARPTYSQRDEMKKAWTEGFDAAHEIYRTAFDKAPRVRKPANPYSKEQV